MANIGFVCRDSYTQGKEVIPTISIEFRTITTRKKFTIAVNKLKYPDGKINSTPLPDKIDHPDYHIWANLSNRGESLPSVIVGNIKNEVSEKGVKYKKGKIFDPFISRENIYFTLFEVEEGKKINKDHIYNVVAEPYRKPNNANGGNGYSNQAAQPYYDEGNTWHEVEGSPTTTMTTANGNEIPVYNEPIREEDIPF